MNQTHILNVLVVDDELPIRQELSMFDWSSLGAALIGEAKNGEEAYYMCRSYQPDVIITDITMPLMDGIELLRRLKHEYPYIQVIILTCHSDFEYARQALEYGAVGYIPKTSMGKNEILQSIEKARTILKKEFSYKKNEIELRRLELSKLFRKMVFEGYDAVKESFDKISCYGIDINFPTHLICMCIEHCPKDWIFLEKIIGSCLSKVEDKYIKWFPSDVGEYIIYMNDIHEDNDHLKQHMEKIYAAIVNEIKKAGYYTENGVHVYTIIGEKVHNEHEYPNSYNIIKKWKSYSFYDWESWVFAGSPPCMEHLCNCNVNEIEKEIRKNWLDYDRLTRLVRGEFTEWVLKYNPPPEELKDYIIKLIDQLEQKTRIVEIDDEFIKRIMEANRFTQLIDILLHHIKNKYSARNKQHPYVRLAIKVISEKLKEPITLASVAWEAGTTPQYLSRIFIKENGETFNEYLTRKRMEKAFELLKNSDLKIYEIAEKVGIPNYRYFSVVFKDWTGVTPKEYRKQ